ncbi:MAG: aspartate 1-decarboxylase [Calditrichae bacterium]|nr:aspartate 1-decarboxylase [Calditrichota bacterium]MCB9059163.1 aspartate 1-decarboxylase [Calditrichia bacterium]
MQRTFLKTKLHRATVTDANLNYEGSLSIDPELMQAADILPYEKVDVVNINNGARFTTYAILGRPNSGEICLNGAAARLGQIGDRVIIITYVNLNEDEFESHHPKAILLDENNHIKSIQESPIGYVTD